MTSDSPARIHGSLVEVDGLGVLLLGKSGIGKSEAALELVMRGHRLVADDVVWVGPDADGRPEGWSDELIRYYMELRGIGIVHVPSLFGEESVMERHGIDLVIRLEAWGTGQVDHIGLGTVRSSVGDFELPTLHLPVAPGRAIASLVEVAARNQRLKRSGRSGAAELDERVLDRLRRAREGEQG